MSASDTDWRLRSQATYLKGLRFERADWMPGEASDHEHCEFCWAKFADASLVQDALPWGYATADRYYWVCASCFDDFRTDFQWVCHAP